MSKVHARTPEQRSLIPGKPITNACTDGNGKWVTANGHNDLTGQYLVRRLRVVLFDLGLDRLLADWAAHTNEGLVFRPLVIAQADELVKALEDLVAHRPRSAPTPGPGQLTLFEGFHRSEPKGQ